MSAEYIYICIYIDKSRDATREVTRYAKDGRGQTREGRKGDGEREREEWGIKEERSMPRATRALPS